VSGVLRLAESRAGNGGGVIEEDCGEVRQEFAEEVEGEQLQRVRSLRDRDPCCPCARRWSELAIRVRCPSVWQRCC
jgi:hypothetical protein